METTSRTTAELDRDLGGYPAAPPRTEEIIAVMRCAGEDLHGERPRGLIVALACRAALPGALDLSELDLDPRRGSVLVRRGKGGRRREVGMDDWGFEQLEPRVKARQTMPVGPLFCVINGRTCGRAWSASAARAPLRRRAAEIIDTVHARRPPMISASAGLAPAEASNEAAAARQVGRCCSSTIWAQSASSLAAATRRLHDSPTTALACSLAA